jgi:hypothetical protein
MVDHLGGAAVVQCSFGGQVAYFDFECFAHLAPLLKMLL